MLTVLAHAGASVAPHDLWVSWRPDPLLLVGLATVAALYVRGTRRRDPRSIRFFAGVAALLIATMSPLEALAGALASAHMAQHLVLMLVAAPLLATSSPLERVMLGLGPTWRRPVGRLRRRTHMTPANIDFVRSPVLVGVVTAATTWWWHASIPYGAALRIDIVHHVEHATLIAVFAWFWWVALVGRHAPRPAAVFMIFGVMMSNVLLGALMTFARSAWYEEYAASTSAWGLTHLADQQLAGVLMWVPPSLLYVPAALWLLIESLDLRRRDRVTGAVDDPAPGDTMALPPE